MRLEDSKFERLFLGGDEAVALAARELVTQENQTAVNIQAFALRRRAWNR